MRFFTTAVLVAGMLGLLFVAAYFGLANTAPEVETTAESVADSAGVDTSATTISHKAEILSVDAAKLDVFMKDSDQPLLIDFWASWCGPCRMQDDILEPLAEEYAGRVTFLRVDVDENKDLAERFEIEALPTLIIMSEGHVVDRFPGVTQAQELRESLLRAGAGEEVAVDRPGSTPMAAASAR
jgi:thioredoxin